MVKYEIWQDNGASDFFVSDAQSIDAVLDEYCREAGYADHADACQQMGWTESPFSIKATGSAYDYTPSWHTRSNGQPVDTEA